MLETEGNSKHKYGHEISVGVPPNTPRDTNTFLPKTCDRQAKHSQLGLCSQKKIKPSKPKYRLRHMYNKYTEALRNGSSSRRVHAQGIRRKKLKYMSPLSKPAYLKKLNDSVLKPLPKITRSKDYWNDGENCNHAEDPDSMDEKMLVEEYLTQSHPPPKFQDQARAEINHDIFKHFVPYRLVGTEMAVKYNSGSERTVGKETSDVNI